MNSSKKIISVVGSNGYIGLPLINSISKDDLKLFSISRETNLSDKNNVENILFDIRQPNKWIDRVLESDIIIYLVAQTDLKLAEKKPDYNYSVTVQPFVSMLEHIENKTIIYLSTVTIFNHGNKLIISENCNDLPISIYDKHKKHAEDALKESINKGNNKGVIFRLSNVYGYSLGEKKNNRNVLNKMIKRTFENEDITVYGKGKYLRDYIFIDDVIDVIKLSLDYIDKINGSTLILSSGKSKNISDVFRLVCDMSKTIIYSKSKVVYVPQPDSMHEINKRSVTYCNERIKKLLNWKPKYSIEEGIEKTIKSFMDEEK